jgi:hypothetical protein
MAMALFMQSLKGSRQVMADKSGRHSFAYLLEVGLLVLLAALWGHSGASAVVVDQPPGAL